MNIRCSQLGTAGHIVILSRKARLGFCWLICTTLFCFVGLSGWFIVCLFACFVCVFFPFFFFPILLADKNRGLQGYDSIEVLDAV